MSTGSQSPSALPAFPASVTTGVSLAWRRLATTVRTVAFWTAAILPLAYVPFVVGIGVGDAALVLLGLVGLHCCCLALGHGYAPADET